MKEFFKSCQLLLCKYKCIFRAKSWLLDYLHTHDNEIHVHNNNSNNSNNSKNIKNNNNSNNGNNSKNIKNNNNNNNNNCRSIALVFRLEVIVVQSVP
jgi:hypothetical protein